MSAKIVKIRLINYKRFRDFTIKPNERINILIGDNEVGKSSILNAIDLVASGNVRRIESIGIDNLLNIDSVKAFNAGDRIFEKLPILKIELYLSGDFDCSMNGKNNSDNTVCDGIRLICEPNLDYYSEINSILKSNSEYFPYDYYSIRFSTFADEGYTGYRKKLRSIIIDSTTMSSEYATDDFIRRMYRRYTEDDAKERANHKSCYRQMRLKYQVEGLEGLNSRVPKDKQYSFGLKSGSAMELESDLMIYENEIGIDNKGTGRQVFVKTDFALERSGDNIDVILIEEPENHLSFVNLRKLIQRVTDTKSGQLFITTHNSMISTRLELQNLLIMHKESTNEPVMLKNISEETAKYFMKAPPASIVEFVLSTKTLLVEGPSEYMLLDKFYRSHIGNSPEKDGVHIIDVRGLSFKRYLEIAKMTGAKVAVLTDNDSDADTNCKQKYIEFSSDSNIEIFYGPNNSKRTFEVVIYSDNTSLCNSLFGNDAQKFMLHNKTEAAYTLLSQSSVITIPDYMKRAIEWIRG